MVLEFITEILHCFSSNVLQQIKNSDNNNGTVISHPDLQV